jgi:hypothetical protein
MPPHPGTPWGIEPFGHSSTVRATCPASALAPPTEAMPHSVPSTGVAHDTPAAYAARLATRAVMTNADADAAAMDAAGAYRARSFTVSPTSDATLAEDLRSREGERGGQARTTRGMAEAEATTKRCMKNGNISRSTRVSGGLRAHLEAVSITLAARSTPLS